MSRMLYLHFEISFRKMYKKLKKINNQLDYSILMGFGNSNLNMSKIGDAIDYHLL